MPETSGTLYTALILSYAWLIAYELTLWWRNRNR